MPIHISNFGNPKVLVNHPLPLTKDLVRKSFNFSIYPNISTLVLNLSKVFNVCSDTTCEGHANAGDTYLLRI